MRLLVGWFYRRILWSVAKLGDAILDAAPCTCLLYEKVQGAHRSIFLWARARGTQGNMRRQVRCRIRGTAEGSLCWKRCILRFFYKNNFEKYLVQNSKWLLHRRERTTNRVDRRKTWEIELNWITWMWKYECISWIHSRPWKSNLHAKRKISLFWRFT